MTTKYQNVISLFSKNSSKKKIKLQSKNKFRNNSTNLFSPNNTKLPNIDIYDKNYNKWPEDTSENRLFKNSFASTFYSTNSRNFFSENSNKKESKKTNLLNYKNLLKGKSYSKYKKNLEINPSFFDIKKKAKKFHNYNNEYIDLYIDEDNDNNGNIMNKENDYSLIIKKLDRWDKDNCFVKQYDKISLYHILNNYYKKKGLSEDLQNLNTMDSLLKSKINYDKIIQNRLNYKSNKVITEFFSPKKETGKKKLNNNLRYSKNNKYNENKSPKKKDKENEDDTKLLSEKLKYETQLHNDLVFVNNIIYNKKCLKREKLKELEEIYKKKSELKKEYDKKYNYFIKDYWLKYDEYDQRYKRLEEMFNQQIKKEKAEKKENKEDENNNDNKEEENKKENEKNEENDIEGNNNENKNENDIEDNTNKNEGNKTKEKIEQNEENNNNFNRSNLKKNSIISKDKFLKEMNFIKNTKLNTINLELKKNVEKLDSDYKGKFKDVNKQKKDMEEQIQIINNELNYYKQVNEELIREHRTYYMNILKKGTDYRKEGLVWIVKNLLELQINLEYQHFPKYLTHEHIDYLIKLANLLLEQSELIIVIKVLRKKQTTMYIDENMQTYNMLDKYMEEHLKEKNIKNNNILLGDTQHKIEMSYGKNMANIVKEIDQKFYKVYQNNKEIMKNYLEKNEEEVKLRNAMEHIKKGLYNSDNFVKDNQASILDAFMCNTKNKDFFSFILKIKNRLNQLDKIIQDLIKNEKDFYLEQIKKINNNSDSKNYDNNFNKDIIKKSLFGEKFDF